MRATPPRASTSRRCTRAAATCSCSPDLEAVDGAEGEIALVFLDGALSHAMRKGPCSRSTCRRPTLARAIVARLPR